MGRRKTNTIQLTMRINFDLIEKLKLINPTLITRDPSTNEEKFRHGALGKYITRLISDDIQLRQEQKDKSKASEIDLVSFMQENSDESK